MLEHSEVLFDYLVDATPVVATCADATGRIVPTTELPFATPTSASNGIIASEAAMPPWSEICFIACILLGSDARVTSSLSKAGLPGPGLHFFPLCQQRRRPCPPWPSMPAAPPASVPRRRIPPRRTTGQRPARSRQALLEIGQRRGFRRHGSNLAQRRRRCAAAARRSRATCRTAACRSAAVALTRGSIFTISGWRLRLAVDRQPHGVFPGHGPRPERRARRVRQDRGNRIAEATHGRRLVMHVPHKPMQPRAGEQRAMRTQPVIRCVPALDEGLDRIVARVAAHDTPLRVENLDRHGPGRRLQEVVDDRAVGRILAGRLVGRQRRVGVLVPAKAPAPPAAQTGGRPAATVAAAICRSGVMSSRM